MKTLGILLLLLLGSTSATRAAEADTLALFDCTELNLDTIYKDDPVCRFSIAFCNRVADTLQIDTAEVSCECLQVEFPRKPILRGDSATLDCTLDMTPYDRGRFRKEIFLYTNLHEQPIELTIRGWLQPRKEVNE